MPIVSYQGIKCSDETGNLMWAQSCKSGFSGRGQTGFWFKFVKIFQACIKKVLATTDTFVANYCWSNRVD